MLKKISIHILVLLGIVFLNSNACKPKKQPAPEILLDRSTRPASEFSKDTAHIKFGFRGESIFYYHNEQEYELWSTWFGGRRIHLDDLREYTLTDSLKEKMFVEILDFVIQKEGEKPTIKYNLDFKDAGFWKKLTTKYKLKIKSVETTTLKEENEALYKSMSEDLKGGNVEYNIEDVTIKTIEDLDKHWELVKIKE